MHAYRQYFSVSFYERLLSYYKSWEKDPSYSSKTFLKELAAVATSPRSPAADSSHIALLPLFSHDRDWDMLHYILTTVIKVEPDPPHSPHSAP